MRNAKQPGDLKAEHRPEAIEARLDAAQSHSYLGDAVLGGIDGCVTTFAVVAGAVGGGLFEPRGDCAWLRQPAGRRLKHGRQ